MAEKFSRQLQRVGRQTLRKLLGSGTGEKIASGIIPTKLHNKAVGRDEMFFQTFLSNIVR